MCVPTWRPAGKRIIDKMKRFFVGGAPQIDDVSYVAVPRDFKVGPQFHNTIYTKYICVCNSYILNWRGMHEIRG